MLEIGCKDCRKQRFKQLWMVNSERSHHGTCVLTSSSLAKAVSDNVLEQLASAKTSVNL